MKKGLRYAFFALLVCAVSSCSKESLDTAPVIAAESVGAIEQELLVVVNDHRESLGYTVLEFSPIAYEYAGEHNDYMIAKGDTNHDNFSARASDIASQVSAEFVAENVAKDYDTALEAFHGWLQSSSHKKTMEGDFTHTAVSVKKDANGNLYYTQLFFR